MSYFDKLYIKSTSSLVGTDKFGNSYYESTKDQDYLGNKKRYVIYQGLEESTKVPAMWHAWLHYLSKEIPADSSANFDWQQEHMPNLTGTEYAYFPDGHDKSKGVKPKVSSDYTPWRP
jgi:NADH:ubiquinone oxidoreductase subunit